MKQSRLRGLHRLDVNARIEVLENAGFLDATAAQALRAGNHVLSVGAADAMIENVIGTFGLPLGVAPNFRVDGRDCLVPMVVEEPSVVAALSAAGRLVRHTGGFSTEQSPALLAGQVHLAGVRDPAAAAGRLRDSRDALIRSAAEILPNLAARGGGLRDVETRPIELDDGESILAVHLLVDTRDAMGANLVNTLCERLADDIEAICGGRAVLRILSNLADHALVVARGKVALRDLGESEAAAIRARDGIVLANRIADADPHRAATHNKGIMNGIDPLAIATGNDWRAIEAGVHAYAARSGRYRAVTEWRTGADGSLEGRIELPLKPGIVGGTVANNPGARIGLALTGARSAAELAGLMAAVGLAQNLAALRALATTGIQAGHMRLHARSAAGRIPEAATRRARPVWPGETATANGKVILFGEHAVVYGRHALALPIAGAVRARAVPADDAAIDIADWNLRVRLPAEAGCGLAAMVAVIEDALGIDRSGHRIEVSTYLPQAMGLGSSAAVAVAVTRALAIAAGKPVDDARVNEIAFECEKLAHGTPSGVDNTLACYGRPLLYRRGVSEDAEPLDIAADLPLLIACSHQRGRTLEQVAAVRKRHGETPAHYERVFDDIDALCLEGADALVRRDIASLGPLMNICHGLLNAIGVSTPQLEHMIGIARGAGATGAKLTGAGGGGSIVALCPGGTADVAAAFAAAGYRTLMPDSEAT